MKKITPLKAIREKCLECSSGQYSEVKNCLITDCALYFFRLGHNPNRVGIGNKKGRIYENRRTQQQVVSEK